MENGYIESIEDVVKFRNDLYNVYDNYTSSYNLTMYHDKTYNPSYYKSYIDIEGVVVRNFNENIINCYNELGVENRLSYRDLVIKYDTIHSKVGDYLNIADVDIVRLKDKLTLNLLLVSKINKLFIEKLDILIKVLKDRHYPKGLINMDGVKNTTQIIYYLVRDIREKRDDDDPIIFIIKEQNYDNNYEKMLRKKLREKYKNDNNLRKKYKDIEVFGKFGRKDYAKIWSDYYNGDINRDELMIKLN